MKIFDADKKVLKNLEFEDALIDRAEKIMQKYFPALPNTEIYLSPGCDKHINISCHLDTIEDCKPVHKEFFIDIPPTANIIKYYVNNQQRQLNIA